MNSGFGDLMTSSANMFTETENLMSETQNLSSGNGFMSSGNRFLSSGNEKMRTFFGKLSRFCRTLRADSPLAKTDGVPAVHPNSTRNGISD
jgi:hypothetical protein